MAGAEQRASSLYMPMTPEASLAQLKFLEARSAMRARIDTDNARRREEARAVRYTQLEFDIGDIAIGNMPIIPIDESPALMLQ